MYNVQFGLPSLLLHSLTGSWPNITPSCSNGEPKERYEGEVGPDTCEASRTASSWTITGFIERSSKALSDRPWALNFRVLLRLRIRTPHACFTTRRSRCSLDLPPLRGNPTQQMGQALPPCTSTNIPIVTAEAVTLELSMSYFEVSIQPSLGRTPKSPSYLHEASHLSIITSLPAHHPGEPGDSLDHCRANTVVTAKTTDSEPLSQQAGFAAQVSYLRRGNRPE
jgi:hypothetical protein